MPTLREQLDTITALKAELTKVRQEEETTPYGARYDLLRDEDTRLKNLLFDASMNFQNEFRSVFGVYPREIDDASRSPFGYVISRKHPIQERN